MNYEEISQAIAKNQPFKHGGTMIGVLNQHNDRYTVWSYSTVIFEENLTTGEKWLNPKKYSQTTSRQQNLIKRAKNLS